MSLPFNIVQSTASRRLLLQLNGPAHRAALLTLLAITVAHWVEHISQAIEIFVLGWPRPVSLGAVGLAFPVLVSSEWLHYLFALITLMALIVLRPAFDGRAALFWNAALIIQVWHHFEHLLLIGQALSRTTLFGSPVPTSIIQLVFPRVELHLAYNLIVFVPMIIAMRLHWAGRTTCECGSQRPGRALRRVGSRAGSVAATH